MGNWGELTLLIGIITPLITGDGATLYGIAFEKENDGRYILPDLLCSGNVLPIPFKSSWYDACSLFHRWDMLVPRTVSLYYGLGMCIHCLHMYKDIYNILYIFT